MIRMSRSRGLTLVEVLIVMAVLGMMVGTVIVGFGAGRSAEVSRTVNQVANTIRYAYDRARVRGEYYRLLIDLDQGTVALQQGDDRMYLPATDRDGRPLVLDEDDMRDRDDRDKRAAETYYRSVQSAVYEVDTGGIDPYSVQAQDVPRARPPLFDSFEQENVLSGLGAPVKLPEGVKIVSVRTAEDPEPITTGQASVYFFPQGRTQFAHVQVKSEDGSVELTIVVQPLTGRVTVEDGLVDLQLPSDLGSQEDELGRRMQRRTF